MISNRYKNDQKPHLKLNALQLTMKKEIEKKVKTNVYSFEDNNCNICGQHDFESLAEKDRYGLKMPVVIRKFCGLVQTNPRMVQDSYNSFYNEEYRKLYVGTDVATKDFFYTQTKKGEALISFLQSNNLTPDNWNDFSVLEIGCGAGGILKPFREMGAVVKGIDLGEEYIEYGKQEHNLNLVSGMLKDLSLPKKPDLIIYSHVMEHILDLTSEFEHIKQNCNENTLLYIEVPGIKNIHAAYRKDFLRYLQNAHTFHFSLGSITNLLNKHGFEMIKGDEYVRSISRKKDLTNSDPVSQYEDTLKYLRKIESQYSSVSNKAKSVLSEMKLKSVKLIKKIKS